MFVLELATFGKNLQFPTPQPRFGHYWLKIHFVLFKNKKGTICLILFYFISIAHTLSHFVKFDQFQAYFVHIMCYLWYLFSWSFILLSWSVIHQIGKVGQKFLYPPLPPIGYPENHPWL